MVRDFRAMFF